MTLCTYVLAHFMTYHSDHDKALHHSYGERTLRPCRILHVEGVRQLAPWTVDRQTKLHECTSQSAAYQQRMLLSSRVEHLGDATTAAIVLHVIQLAAWPPPSKRTARARRWFTRAHGAAKPRRATAARRTYTSNATSGAERRVCEPRLLTTSTVRGGPVASLNRVGASGLHCTSVIID